MLETSRHLYRMRPWPKAFYTIAGLLLLGLLIGLPVADADTRANPMLLLLISAFLLPLGLYGLALPWRSFLLIEGSCLQLRDVWRIQSVDRSELAGYRTMTTQYGSFTRLICSDSGRKISVANHFAFDGGWQTWLRPLPNLDAKEQLAETDAILHDASIGSSPFERGKALATAKRQSTILTSVTVVSAIAVNFTHGAFQVVSALLLVLLPPAAVGLLARTPSVWTLSGARNDPRAEAAYPTLAAGFGLIFIQLNQVSLVHWQSLVVPASIALAVLAGIPLKAILPREAALGKMALFVLFGALYAWGTAVAIDAIPDTATPQVFSVPITGRRVSEGKSTSYYLELAPWGPIQEGNELGVSADLYRETQTGDSVCIGLHRGLLKAQWYAPTDCVGAR